MGHSALNAKTAHKGYCRYKMIDYIAHRIVGKSSLACEKVLPNRLKALFYALHVPCLYGSVIAQLILERTAREAVAALDIQPVVKVAVSLHKLPPSKIAILFSYVALILLYPIFDIKAIVLI
jgi:hypothetical protein